MTRTTILENRADESRSSGGFFNRTTPSSSPTSSSAVSRPGSSLPAGASVPGNLSTVSSPAVQPKAESSSGNRLLVGPDVKLKGAEILDCDTLVVEGRVEATMDSHIIRIAEQGTFSGTVSIDTAEIHGSFEGELTARTQLIIHATGRVNGKIRYGKILIEEGGQICGDIQSTTSAQGPVGIKAEHTTSSPTKAVAASA